MQRIVAIVMLVGLLHQIALGQVRCGTFLGSKRHYDSILVVEKGKRFSLISDTTKSIIKLIATQEIKFKNGNIRTDTLPFVDVFFINERADTLKNQTGPEGKCYMAVVPDTYRVDIKFTKRQTVTSVRLEKGHFYTFYVDLDSEIKHKKFGLLKGFTLSDELSSKKDLTKE